MKNLGVFFSMALVAGSLGGLGCLDDQQSPSIKAYPAFIVSPGPQPDIIDPRGNRWIWVKQVTPLDINVADQEKANGPIYSPSTTPASSVPSTPTDLAAKLHPRRLWQGHEYTLDHDPVELASAILASPSPPPTDPHSAPSSSSPGPSGTSAYIIGTDDRVYDGSLRQLWPWSTTLYVNPQDCGATMIGRSTAVSAAHCYYNHGWISTNKLVPAADGLSEFWGNIPSNYISFTLPGGWNGNGDWDYDYAVIEFGFSGIYPGDRTGWLGTIQDSDNREEIDGFPGDKPVPQLWGGWAGVFDQNNTRLKHSIDIIPGDSGSGMYMQRNHQVDGIQSTQNYSWFFGYTYWNEATRWNATLYNFYHQYGLWPS